MKLLIDTNLFLDVLFDRESLGDESERVLSWCEASAEGGWIAWHTLANLYYIGMKAVGMDGVEPFIEELLQKYEVCPCDTHTARMAWSYRMKDFEDGLQCAAAVAGGVDYIVTRNTRDFKNAPISVLSPKAFLKKIDAKKT